MAVFISTKTLNRPVRTTYADGTYSEVTYNLLDVEWSRDPLGRWSRTWVDALRRPVVEMDYLSRITVSEWCSCGSLEALIDPAGRRTTWLRDVQKRVVSKIQAGQLIFTNSYTPQSGRLDLSTDALGQQTHFSYNLDNTVANISYTDALIATPGVSTAYDPVYGRTASMTDGTGLTIYTFHPITAVASFGANQLASIEGPLADDTIAFTYDELGRELTHSINGVANASSQTYDALGRVTNMQNPLGSFALAYQNQTNRMNLIIYPNGQRTDYEYWNRTAPNNADSGEKGDSLRRLKRITNLGGGGGLAVLSDSQYHYDQAGRITDWTRAATGEPAESTDLSYDAADQLTGAILRNAGTVIREQFYRYDLAGNRTRNQLGLVSQKGHYDTRNQLTELTADDQLTFTGTVSEPSQVRVAGNLARVEADGHWRVDAPVLAGENNLALTATDQSGNVTSKTIQITVAGLTTESFTYDLNGNTTSDGQRSYEWDAANRLVAINQLGTTPLKRSEFTYDGASRNTRIVEKEATNIISDKRFVYLGTNKAEDRDPANTVTKRYYPQGFTLNSQPSTTDTFFYSRDHLGSIREVTDATGTLRASYKYDLYGQRTKATGDIESDFGFTNQYHHESSGLDLFLYRAYNPKTARWLSRDPIGEEGGINLYGYVANNPVNAVDPLGLFRLDPNFEKQYPKASARINSAANRLNYIKYSALRNYSGTTGISPTITRKFIQSGFSPGQGPTIAANKMQDISNRGNDATYSDGNIDLNENLLKDYECGKKDYLDDWLDATLEHEFIHHMEHSFKTRMDTPNNWRADLYGGFHAPKYYEIEIYGWQPHPQ